MHQLLGIFSEAFCLAFYFLKETFNNGNSYTEERRTWVLWASNMCRVGEFIYGLNLMDGWVILTA